MADGAGLSGNEEKNRSASSESEIEQIEAIPDGVAIAQVKSEA